MSSFVGKKPFKSYVFLNWANAANSLLASFPLRAKSALARANSLAWPQTQLAQANMLLWSQRAQQTKLAVANSVSTGVEIARVKFDSFTQQNQRLSISLVLTTAYQRANVS